MSDSLGTALPKEMQRVRELIPIYAQFQTGSFAIMLMNNDLSIAEKAMMEQDIPSMAQVYEKLQGYNA